MMIEVKETRTRLYTVSDMTDKQKELIFDGLEFLNLNQYSEKRSNMIKEMMVIFR